MTGRLIERTLISTSRYFFWSPGGKRFAFDAEEATSSCWATATASGTVLTRDRGIDGYCRTLAWRWR